MPTHNFLQWGPQQTNTQSDAQYATETLRANGATIGPSVFPSNVANKLFYQLTTFVKCFADALGAKGYSVSDQAASTLAAQLLNVMTQADMAPYALLQSPAFRGVPTAPAPATGTRSGQLATMSMFANEFAASLQGVAGWQKFPSGLILQWGQAFSHSSGPTAVTFPIAFPNEVLEIYCSAIDTGPNFANGTGATPTGFLMNDWFVGGGGASRGTANDMRYLAIGH